MEENYSIDLTSFYNSNKEFNEDIKIVNKKIDKIKKYKNKILNDENKLYEVLNLDKEISILLENLYVYSKLYLDINLTNKEANISFNTVVGLYGKYANAASFVVPEIIQKDFKFIKKYITNNSKLKEYENSLSEIFRLKKHVLSDDAESLLSSFNGVNSKISSIHASMTNLDIDYGTINIDGKDILLTPVNYNEYLSSSDKKVRDEVYKKVTSKLDEYKHTASNLLNLEITSNNLFSKLKKYKSSLERYLFENNIDVSIYDNLIKSINKNLGIVHNEWNMRKNILKLKELSFSDVLTPITKDVDNKYTFEEARNLVQEVLLIMGSEYSNLVNELFANNRIDANIKENKKSIAYSICSYMNHPYVFMNFNGDFRSVSTLIHEIGHAMHFEYSKNNNSYTNYNYSIFVAEVASQVNEILLSKYLFDKLKTREEKMMILDNSLNIFKHKIVTATMYSEFEKNIYELNSKQGMFLTDDLNNNYLKILKKYYGESFNYDENIKVDWVRNPIYYNKFYAYQYATGYVAALEIAENIYARKDNALENYFEFLKTGSKKDPVTSLKIAGVDITNSKIYNKAFKNFEDMKNKFENLYNSKEN